MRAPAPDYEIEQRLTDVERRLADTLAVVSEHEHRVRVLERRPEPRPRIESTVHAESTARIESTVHAQSTAHAESTPRATDPAPLPKTVPPWLAEDPDYEPARAARSRIRLEPASLSDFLGGRALAWIGGIVTLLGIVLLLGLAISHGWIGPTARVVLAAAGSTALMAGGVWLHARRGRTEAAVAMVGAATAGWFATVTVAADVYHLIPAPVAVATAIVAGALATALAIRWAGRAIAALGLVGGLVTPLLVGAPDDAVTLALVAVGAICAMWVVCWRRWPWLAFATVLACAPQWALWLAAGQRPVLAVGCLVTFGAIGLAGAVLAQLRGPAETRTLASASALVLLNVLLIGAAGRFVFGSTGGAAWLAGIALVHTAAAFWRWPRIAIHDTLRRLLISVAVVAADVALASTLHGLALMAAWGVPSVAFAVLMRRTPVGASGERWLEVGLGAHVSLVLFRTLVGLSPAELTSRPELVPLASSAILAATCLASARLSGPRQVWRRSLDCLGLLAIGYITASTLSGPALVCAWAVEAVALAEIARRAIDPVARYGAFGFLAAAGLHALTFEAPASGLVTGVDSLGGAALAVAAASAATLRIGQLAGPRGGLRPALIATGGVAMLYLASLAIITAFQPAAGTESVILLDLSVRQQGQVLLSALWGLVGFATLVVGLRRNIVLLRTGALALLMATVAKVFFYDLSTLTSIYRVISFLVVGGLLLAGAFAYQRLRPPPLPDLREVHPSQR